MFRRYFLPLLAGIAFLFSTSLLVLAQSGQVTGLVTLKQADGTIVPGADAGVDIFRTDMPGDFSFKANKKGVFVHADLPMQGSFIVSVSMPGAQPYFLPNVRPGSGDDIKIELAPGDGKRLTRADIKTIMARTPLSTPSGAKETSEYKAKRDEIIRKNKEIEESNKKAGESNAIIDRTFKAGNEAMRVKNYDLAIAQYDEGLTADPEHPGAPALLTNKTIALNARAVDKYNGAIKSTDDAAKSAGMEAAKKDWQGASEASAKAVVMLKAVPAPTDAAGAAAAKRNLYFALMARADVMRLFVVKVDQSQVDPGVTAYQEYIAVESDPVKKSKAEHDLAQLLFDANVFDRALIEYKKILATNPEDLDALLHAGQALFNIGAINSDPTKYDEAKKYLTRFVEKASDTDPLKADTKAILDSLKEMSKAKPNKAKSPARRTRRP